jgi:hypothetical protein
MMTHGKSIIRNYMTMNFQFAGTRLQDGYLTPVDWDLSVNLIVSVKKSKLKEDAEYRASITYQKLYFWLEANLQGIVFVDVGSEDDLYIANLSSNITVYCPGNPGDDMIIRLIHAKLSTLAGNDMTVGELKLKGSDTSLQYTYDCPTGEYELPETTDYITIGKCRDAIPWWNRNDGFCFEFVKPEDTEETDEEIFKDIIDPMTEFERTVAEMENTRIGMVKEPAKIVQVEKWKPRKIE